MHMEPRGKDYGPGDRETGEHLCPPLRPLGAGSEVRRRSTGQLTDAQAARVLRAIYAEDPEPESDLTPRGAAVIVAACTVGALGLVVGLAYLFAAVL